MAVSAVEVRITIVGEALPSRAIGEHTNVHIGIQKGKETVDILPADSVAEFDITVERLDNGDWRGPFVQGKRGDRFLYLVWCDVDPRSGLPSMFSRIKLMLAAIPESLSKSTALEAKLRLTNARGGLRTASVRPPDVVWSGR